jgi:hypothetical protein
MKILQLWADESNTQMVYIYLTVNPLNSVLPTAILAIQVIFLNINHGYYCPATTSKVA